jgi:predicted regulator of Ras-like GTPase activity (Roadblock/LC7/MglB family)
MDAAQALADLTEISSQIQAAVVFDEQATVIASTLADEARTRTLVGAAAELLAAAASSAPGEGELVQLEAATSDGSVFVVRDRERRIVATTGPEPTVGLVFYDLKSCLRGLEEQPPKRRRKRTAATADTSTEDADGAA